MTFPTSKTTVCKADATILVDQWPDWEDDGGAPPPIFFFCSDHIGQAEPRQIAAATVIGKHSGRECGDRA